MDYFYKNALELTDKNDYKSEGNLPTPFFNRHFLYVKATDNDKNNNNNNDDDDGNNVEDDDKADINTEERENVKEIQQYQQYQESQQNQQPWSDSSDIRIVDSDELPDPHPITDTEVCSKCGNNQARWWIVQTDSADEPSTQFFRCTKCHHTWRTTRSS
jgi:DNA-directed RNA polymerase subunit M/transcription elongation factor TFIIS